MTSSSWFLPDTHAVVWHFLNDERLSERARAILRGAESGDFGLLIPTIVLAETQLLYERKLPEIPMSRILQRFEELQTVLVVPFDSDVFKEFSRLPSTLDIHDRVIAATANHFGAGLITRDAVLARVVETIW